MFRRQLRPIRWAALVVVGSLVAICSGASQDSGLQYRWQTGQDYAYRFTISVQDANETATLTGGCIYTVTSAKVISNDANSGPIIGTGTGFVVTADGYLVTCNHVVDGAKNIKVVLEGKTFEAQVVAKDKQHDLALIRIPSGGLPVLPLSDSEKVELNQDVLVVGYPLSTSLGENIKMSRGIISGINTSKGNKDDKVFQVDAAINPGNSGGPVVNENGQLVGVASAKLVGDDVSNVGFIVPSNQVADLLKSQGIKFAQKDGGETLKSTELAKKVKPSTAFLTVTIDPNALIAERRLLTYRAYCNTVVKNQPPIVKTDQGNFIASVQGEISNYVGGDIVPFAGGRVGDLLIEPLANNGKKQWQVGAMTKVGELVEVTVPVNPAPAPAAPMPAAPMPRRGTRPGHGMRPGVPNGFGGLRSSAGTAQSTTKKAVFNHLAAERSSYEIADSTGDVLTINKHYELTTIPQPGRKPYMQIDGTGSIEFDQKAGVPRRMSLNLTLDITDRQGRSGKVPMSVSYERVEPSALQFPGGSATVATSSVVGKPPSINSAAPSVGAAAPSGTFVARPSPATGSVVASVPGGMAPPRQPMPAPAQKQPAPEYEALSKTEALVADLFKKDFDASKTSSKKLELARKLMEHGRTEKSDHVARYVLFDKASKLAADAGDVELSFTALDALVSGYEIDGLALKADLIASLVDPEASVDKQRTLARAGAGMIEDALEADRYDIVKRIGSLALTAAKKSKDVKLTKRIQDSAQQYKALQEAYAPVHDAEATLKTKPDDAEANLIVGRFRCFFKGDWGRGLAQLAKANDAELKTLAAKELAAGNSADQQLAVADGWYEMADRHPDIARRQLLSHASQLYAAALPNLSGLGRIKAEKRIVTTAEPADEVDDASGGTAKQQFARLLQRLRAQIKDQQISKTQEAGLANGKLEFSAVPETGGLLVGFEIGSDVNRVTALRPIFLTEKGQSFGPVYGVSNSTAVKILAKKGYAVGAVNVKAGLWLDGLSVTFMEIGPTGLNPAKSYESEWVGGQGGNPARLTGAGAPVIGIFGHGSTKQVTALGLVLGSGK